MAHPVLGAFHTGTATTLCWYPDVLFDHHRIFVLRCA